MPEPTSGPNSLSGVFAALAREVEPQVAEHHPAAARMRGRQRAVHRRLAASVLAAALVAGGSSAVALLSRHHAALPGPVNASPPPTPATTYSLVAPAPSASLGASGGPSPSTASSTAQADIDPATVLAAAWLTAAQLQDATGFSWAGGAIPLRTMDAAENNLGTCLSGDPRQVGAETRWQIGADINRSAGGQAYQVQYFYPNAAAARDGLAAFEAVYAHCQGVGTRNYLLDPHLIDTVRDTVQADGRFAMLRTVRHPDGTAASSPAVGSDSHEFLAQKGNVIYFFGLYGGPAIDDSTHDAQVLAAMLTALGNYWK